MSVATNTDRFFEQGACVGLDPDLFHPERGASIKEARATCASCQVRVACLEFALANQERFGIWGGTSERERRRIRRRLAAGQPAPELDPEWVPAGRLPIPPPLPLPPPPIPDPPARLPITEDPVMELVTATPTLIVGNGSRPTDPATGLPTDACVNCGKRYQPKRRDQRFHSKECARAWYAAHPRGEGGQRRPRIRKQAAKRQGAAPAPVPSPVPAPQVGLPVDLPHLLGQLLAACDRWAIEADLGDIRISVTRGCPRP